ncbi:MAG: hypothetical protein ACXVXC_04560 [Nocardioidaceae bacterium]
MVVVGLLLVGLIVVALIVLLGLRRWTFDEARTENRLRQPGAHTLTYIVPEGQDAAVLVAALVHAGYTSVTDVYGGFERLLVACEEKDRAQVRSILEHVDRAGFAGPEMHVDHVRFQDEH